MSSTLREQLESMTVIVADTGDIHSIQKVTPRDATTNPSLILKAAEMAEYQDVVEGSIAQAREDAGEGASAEVIASHAMDRLAVEFGLRILEIIPGRISTEVDARLSFDTEATIAKARHLIGLYAAKGIGRERILIKIASTWEGIRAAEVLEQEGIHCNLTLLFGLHQAIACAEAGITLISPFVGRILDWHKQKHGRDFAPSEDPGVASVTEIYNYYKKFAYKTEVMGASFRNIGEIIELAGCDLLTIAPNYIDDLAGMTGTLERKLDPAAAAAADIEQITIDRATFDRMHAADAMATDKLAEGIEKFSADIVKLEQQLLKRIG